jgi:hypothetical protein
MDTKRMQVLNAEYEPLRTHTRNMVKALTSSGYECEWGYFAQHSVRNGDEWFFEHYPIPVITVKNVCELGFDLDQTFIEFKLKRDAAIAFDFTRFNGFTFEVYGLADYLNDFYNADQDIKDIHAKIGKSDEKEIGVSLLFGYLESVEHLMQAVKKLKEMLNAELA